MRIQSRTAAFPFLISLLAFWAQCAVAGVFYVAKNGSDSNAGTQAAPFVSIGKAISVTVAGDTVNIADGTYSEALKFAKAGNASSRITFNGTGPSVVIKGSVSFSGSYTTLDNVRVDAPGSQYGSAVSVGGSYNELRRVTISSYGATAANQATAITTASGSHHNTVDSCTVKDLKDIDVFHLWGHDNTVTGCSISNIQQINYSANHTDVIQTWSLNGEESYNISFLNNSVRDCSCQLGNTEGNGQWSKMHDWTVGNNVIVNVTGALFWGLPTSRFYGNVFDGGGTMQGYVLSLYGSEPKYRSNGFEIKNNVWRGPKGINFNNQSSTGGTTTNNYFGTASNGAVNSAHFKGSAYIDGGDPRFVSATDYHLQSGSVLIGKGTAVSLATDKDGKIRTNPWDIGAYAYAGVQPTPSATPAPTVSPTATPAPSASPTPPSTAKFKIGDTVANPAKLVNVRDNPGGNVVDSHDAGTMVAIVLAGPTLANLNGAPVNWYQLDIQTPVGATDGWIGEDNLELYVGPVPTPTPSASPSPSASPNPSPTPCPSFAIWDSGLHQELTTCPSQADLNAWLSANPPVPDAPSK